ncbi:PAS domain S-box protein [Desulfosporosinus fructosivorans]|uniref:histidine kinase n=1 Tax=Desulfosporosinus fructosivorans TaxID=2018669 RepID=A0A4Z0R7N4_9FIRM|nr:PAS domain S-box protein [Desulfosporosinus fructosivorans]TGE38405.1 PAS domain S-box protein [Desulfosporosinus fructosivorans]
MSTNKVISELEQRVASLEAALVEARNYSGTWERIFKESYWGIMVCDAITDELIKVNICYAEMHGYSISELLGKTIYDVFAPEYHSDLPEIIHRIHDHGHHEYNSVHIRKDGSCFPVHTDSYEVTVDARRLRIVSVWDITESELKEKELCQYRESLEELVRSRTRELEHSNEQLRMEIIQRKAAENELAITNQRIINTMESISDGFITINRQWIITFVNKAIVKVLVENGIHDNFIGTNFWEVYPHVNRKIIDDNCLKVMKEGQPKRFEAFVTQIGQWLEISISPTESGISIFSRNIDERKKIEKAVEEEHQRLYSLFHSFPGLIYVQEDNHNIRFANSNFQAKFGPYEGKPCYEVIVGLNTPCSDCLHRIDTKDFKSRWKEVVFDNRFYEVYAQPFTDADGSRLVFKVLLDITERKNADRELARLERLNMVGEMAAGIAHEVRNPLTTVRGFLQLLTTKENTKQYQEFYELMIEELDRANFIISDFLSLAHDKTFDFELTNISEMVRNLFPLLAADALNQDKEIILELEQVPDILGNINELRQLLLNITRNGLEAMPVGTILTIQTLRVEEDIILRVCDQGAGIDPVIFEKLGTPFMTTKDQGTGLGLAICQTIAVRHHAVISYESNSSGTTVTVKFPGVK